MVITRHKNKMRLMTALLAFFLILSMLFGAITQVFAATDTDVDIGDGKKYTVNWTDVNGDGYFTDTEDTIDVCSYIDPAGAVIGTEADGVTPIYGPSVVTVSDADTIAKLKAKVAALHKKSAAAVTDQAIDDIFNGLNVKADLASATMTLGPLTDIVNAFIGVIATFILLLIGLLTAIDVLYLEVPTLHSSMDTKAMEKGETSKKTGSVKPKVVSEDASRAYEEAAQNGKNPLLVYLKKRIVAYIAVAIVLYMLLSGNLALIVKVVLKALNGVFNWVEEYSEVMPS